MNHEKEMSQMEIKINGNEIIVCKYGGLRFSTLSRCINFCSDKEIKNCRVEIKNMGVANRDSQRNGQKRQEDQ